MALEILTYKLSNCRGFIIQATVSKVVCFSVAFQDTGCFQKIALNKPHMIAV